jgi:hypothetical protein
MGTVNLQIGRPTPDTDKEGVVRAGDAIAGARSNLRRPPHHLVMTRSQDIVHGLLFIMEYSNSRNPQWRKHKRRLSLFFSRHGGLHLLMMLLNAYYNKPAAGRRPGWVFNGLRERIDISERGLRMLINDAVEEGLIELQPIPSEIDRRRRSYRLTPPVIRAWEGLTESLLGSMGEIFEQFDAGALANVDYRNWDPSIPAHDQIDRLPPSHRLRRIKYGRQQVLRSKSGAAIADNVFDLTEDMTFDCSDEVTRTLAELREVANNGELRCSAPWLEGKAAKCRDRCLIGLTKSGHVAIRESANGVAHIEEVAAFRKAR